MSDELFGRCNVANVHVLKWVDDQAKLCRPQRIFWCDGSGAERRHLTQVAVEQGILLELNQEKWPGCHYHRSNLNDVARTERCTFICSPTAAEAGPTNNWMAPSEAYAKMRALCDGAMEQRTMYVVPYLMGPPGSPFSMVGIELTDSIYVVLSMRIMARAGAIALDHLGTSEHFNRGLHCMLDVNPERRYICHFPQDNTVVSVGSAYGGNALLGKKCLALRIASSLARRQGWLAEHMLILGVESPEGEKTYVAAAFPSACGKTNFAMLTPPARFRGWKIWTVGDDIAWMHPGKDGRLYAINPEAGYFGVVPGTNYSSNPNAMKIMSRDTIFTNVALTSDNGVWWEGKDGPPPGECLDWKGNRWTPAAKERAAHPNSRFASPMGNNPMLCAEVTNPDGVPISAIIFGGRRSDTLPLVYEAFNWIHGVYLGATMSSETTSAAVGQTGEVRRDPMAMLPFCGYNMGDYFHHWIRMRERLRVLPRVFHVNWFRKSSSGEFLWPGFGENLRILKWMVDRCHGRASAEETAVGWMPLRESVDLEGSDRISWERFKEAQKLSREEWTSEIARREEWLRTEGLCVPKELFLEHELQVARLNLHRQDHAIFELRSRAAR